MKTLKKITLLIIFLLPVLFLTSCEDADWDLLEIAFESWAEENNLYEDGEWQPDGIITKAVEDTIKDITNNQTKVQIDGLDVIRDIEKADEIASDAMLSMDTVEMAKAIELRPYDWTLREQHAMAWAMQPNPPEEPFLDSDNLIRKQMYSEGGDCVKLRTQQLEYREILLSDTINECAKGIQCDNSYLASELESVQEQLFYIYDGLPIAFCSGI